MGKVKRMRPTLVGVLAAAIWWIPPSAYGQADTAPEPPRAEDPSASKWFQRVQEASDGCAVLDAVPHTRAFVTDEEITREVAARTPDVLNGRVTIIKAGDKYFYASREHRELIHTMSGVYHTFADPLSMSTVKIVRGDLPSLSAGLLNENELHTGYRFTATVSLGLAVWIYFGDAAFFDPNCE
ncbi:MAG: hypothetical protein OXG35_33710 [Acidobacteria bacterium]|nr:hypothetical protein [Acidobacteriota bacterium]